MNNKFLIYIIFNILVSFTFVNPLIGTDFADLSKNSQSHSNCPKAKIGHIDMSLATALHPKMALFSFQEMGFLKLPLGLKGSEYRKQIQEISIQKNTKELEKRISETRKLLTVTEAQISEIIVKEKTPLLSGMSETSKVTYKELDKHRKKLLSQLKEIEYELRFPYLTSRAETRKILSMIEKEASEAVRVVAKNGNYDVILNKSVNPCVGFQENYKPSTEQKVGPAGIDQTLYYGFLTKSLGDRVEEDIKNTNVQEWLSMISRPETQDYLPLKPWPLVIEGGNSILSEVLQKLYNDNGISNEVFLNLVSVLNKLELVN